MDDDEDDEVSQDHISENTINEELFESHTELLNTSAPSNTKVPARDLNELQTIRFIELLKEEVCLWDTKFIYDCYHDVGNNAIKKLAEKLKEEFQLELDVNAKFVRAKIRQLKSIFRSGSKSEQSKSLFSHLSFLQGHVSSKRSKSAICGEEVEDDDYHQALEKEHITNKTARKENIYIRKIYTCLLCNRDDFTTQASYKSHLTQVHPNKEPLENVVQRKQIHTCEHCGDAAKVNFTSKSELIKHIAATHPELRFVYNCTKCKERCKTRRKLKMHIQSSHSVADSPNEPTEYECEFCHHDPFVSQSDLELHIKLKHYDMIAVPKEVSQPKNWEASSHSAIDSPNESIEYKCEFCHHDPFVSQSDLELHNKLKHYDMIAVPKEVSQPKNWEASSHSAADSPNESTEYECAFFHHDPFVSQSYLELHNNLKQYDMIAVPKEVSPPKNWEASSNLASDSPNKSTEYECEFCHHDPFVSQSDLERHNKLKHYDMIAVPKEVSPPKNLEASSILASDSPNKSTEYECEFCYHVPFLSKTDLKLHIKLEHYDIPPLVVSPPKKLPDCLICNRCKMSFSTPYILNTHLEREHDVYVNDRSNSCVCEYCGKIFELPRALRRHRKIVHIWVGQHKCGLCDCAYSSGTRLRLHVNSVHRKEPTHVCDICSAGFYAKRYLNQHKVKIHKFKRPFQCKQCDSEFFLEHSLRHHKQMCKGKKL